MKQYKLIKEYPGSPKLGTIVNHVKGWGSYESYFDGDLVYSTYAIENYPEFWQEIKEPLFTTEDGVNLYEGDHYYAVYSTWLYDRIYLTPGNPVIFKHTKNFSTKEKAEKYINKNKAKYSEKDIENACTILSDNLREYRIYIAPNRFFESLMTILEDEKEVK